MAELTKLLAAYVGESDDQVRAWLSPAPDTKKDNEPIRTRARTLKRLHIFAYGLFVATCVAFLVALLVLASAIPVLAAAAA